MSLIRMFHGKENPYAMINRDTVRDKDLSLKARGLLVSCLSYPDHWKFHVTAMAKECGVGPKVIYRIIDELIEKNYCIKIEITPRKGKSRFQGKYIEYIFFEGKQTDHAIAEYTELFTNSILKSLESNGDDQKGANPAQNGDDHNGFAQNDPLGINVIPVNTDKKIIIAPPSPKPTAAAGNKKSSNAKKEILKPKKFEVERPVAPKPQMHACLATCHDLSDAQKIQLSRASVELVEAAVRYSYHPTTKQYEGNAGRMRQLQHFIKNPELFTETMQNLDKPKAKSSKEKITSSFKHGEYYNGLDPTGRSILKYEFCQDDKACWFVMPGYASIEAYRVFWKDADIAEKFASITAKLGIQHV